MNAALADPEREPKLTWHCEMGEQSRVDGFASQPAKRIVSGRFSAGRSGPQAQNWASRVSE